VFTNVLFKTTLFCHEDGSGKRAAGGARRRNGLHSSVEVSVVTSPRGCSRLRFKAPGGMANTVVDGAFSTAEKGEVGIDSALQQGAVRAASPRRA